MLKIALLGYGQMGRMLEQLAPQADCKVVKIFDPNMPEYDEDINVETLRDVDVCIDFTAPSEVVANIDHISSAGKNIVVGTTGWFNDLSNVENMIRLKKTGLIYASNFSIGMNLFFLFAEKASRLVGPLGVYDVFGYELHHRHKVDSPSGTAKDLAEILRGNFPNKKSVVYDKLDRKIEESELHFASVRGGNFPGTHVFGFDSPFDTIEVKHTARNREGFAIGALKAAQWIKDREGVFEFQDIFSELL
ncbi:MAG: 4-hydroxy-tetrahydrodipicolinate reductase [Candidatus Cloacimonas sp.]|nr:4-hydroxy-tetrahydrodipicolinate reductase [Candidatus Cloacimonadota bacterium]